MNLSLNHTNAPAAQAGSAAPAAVDAATQDVAGAKDAGQAIAGSAQPAPAQPALAFAQWLGLEPLAQAAVDGADDAGGADGATMAAPDGAAAVEEQQATADTPLLGAMTMNMPLLPTPQATLAAVVAALPGASNTEEAAPAVDTDPASPPVLPVAHRGASLAVADSALKPVAGTVTNAGAAPAALPAETLASSGGAPQDQLAPTVERGAANTAGVASATPGNAQRTADTVTLSGPPAAWRQTLQEALGDRLQLQVGKNAEQAVIRLEPPMLGRVEIAIRHSAGSLEVHISATHGEVLRQLQAVGENLRNDLAQRQFTDVAVNIAQAPRGTAAGNMNAFAGDGSGRGRQHEGQEEQHPGKALAEANTGASPFSLNGRASTQA